MRRCILLAGSHDEFANVCDHLGKGWALDPDLGYVRLEAGVVYHLIQYEEGEEPEEEQPLPSTESDKLAAAVDFIEIKTPDEPGVIPGKYPGWVVYKATKGSVQLYKPREEAEG